MKALNLFLADVYGVSYLLANRGVMTRSFPELMAEYAGWPVRHYPIELLEPLLLLRRKGRNPY